MRRTGIRRQLIAATHFGLVVGLLAGCGPEDGGQLAFKIHYNPGTPVDGLRSNDPPTAGTAPADITDYRICVTAPDGKKPKCQNFNRADNPGGAKLGGLKPGSERAVTFQGYDVTRDYEVRWCGNASNIAVKSNKTTQVSMYISVCSDFTEVRNTMQQGRAFHTATRLSDGRVMVIGGFSSLSAPEACDFGACHKLSATSSIDIYDPATGQFEPSSGLELTRPRAMHTATLLPSGKVLVAGGAGRAVWRISFPSGPRPPLEIDLVGDDTQAGNSAKLIDPASRTVEEINLTTPRAQHQAVSFSNGDVLLVGGITPADNSPLASMSRYEVTAGGFADVSGSSLNVPRQAMAITKFANRSYLLWGGNHADNPEPGVFAEILFEEGDGSPFILSPLFIQNAEATQGDPAFFAAAASPQDNQVLACGGMIVDQAYDSPPLTDRVRILNTFRLAEMTPTAESFVDIGSETMRFMRAFHSATLLPGAQAGGEIVVAGGVTRYDLGSQEYTLTERVEFFSPAELSFQEKQIDSRPVELSEPRAGHAVVALEDGSLLITGGLTESGTGLDVSETAEIYNPAPRSLRVE